MTDYTPAQARVIAYEQAKCPAAISALLSLADQVDALTAEWECFLAAGRVLAKVTQEFIELTAERDALKNPPNAWADLWYFVMDEEPMAFEKIVTECSPKIWHSEAHKLMRATYPK